MDLNFIHIDKINLLRSIYIFQYNFLDLGETTHDLERSLGQFVEQFSQYVELGPNVLMLFSLNKEKKFLNALREMASSLSLADFNIVCIENGYLISSWLKKL